jgi:hypothetical protein
MNFLYQKYLSIKKKIVEYKIVDIINNIYNLCINNNIYNSCINKLNNFEIDSKYLYLYLYLCIHYKLHYLKYVINVFLLYKIFQYKYVYFYELIDFFFCFEIFLKKNSKKIINYLFPINNNCYIEKILLYTHLNDYHIIDKSMYHNINKFDKNFIDELFLKLNIKKNDNNDIRLKIFFKYENIEYILYLPYEENIYLPFPFYTKEIMENYKNDYIYPLYVNTKEKEDKTKYFYSLFHIDSKDISEICINNVDNNELIDYFYKIQTPFYDFGILYGIKIKLIWCLVENNIDVSTFEEFYLKYENLYLDEENYELIEHSIKLSDTQNFLISDIIQKTLTKVL